MYGDAVADFDRRIDEAFGRLRGNPVADALFYATSALGDYGVIWVIVAGTRASRDPARRARLWRMLAASGLASASVNRALKALVHRDRPAVEGEHPLPVRIPVSGSFPSGHSLAAFCSAAVFVEGSSWAGWAGYLSLASLIGASRVYVKMHHASDVVAGAAIGTLLGLGIKLLFRALSRP